MVQSYGDVQWSSGNSATHGIDYWHPRPQVWNTKKTMVETYIRISGIWNELHWNHLKYQISPGKIGPWVILDVLSARWVLHGLPVLLSSPSRMPRHRLLATPGTTQRCPSDAPHCIEVVNHISTQIESLHIAEHPWEYGLTRFDPFLTYTADPHLRRCMQFAKQCKTVTWCTMCKQTIADVVSRYLTTPESEKSLRKGDRRVHKPGAPSTQSRTWKVEHLFIFMCSYSIWLTVRILKLHRENMSSGDVVKSFNPVACFFSAALLRVALSNTSFLRCAVEVVVVIAWVI